MVESLLAGLALATAGFVIVCKDYDKTTTFTCSRTRCIKGGQIGFIACVRWQAILPNLAPLMGNGLTGENAF